jgi:hypothetical protein
MRSWPGARSWPTFTLDQRAPGDAWHELGSVRLSVGDEPILRIRNGGGGILLADAILVSSEARYNDGSTAPTVTLAPHDGIVLKRD